MSLLNNNFTRFLLKVCQHKHLHEKCLKSKFSKYKALFIFFLKKMDVVYEHKVKLCRSLKSYLCLGHCSNNLHTTMMILLSNQSFY